MWKAKVKQGDKNAEAIQQAMKILINSLYGFYGAGGYCFNDMDAAERVTMLGRKILTVMVSVIEQIGWTVVEADTDGIIVRTDDSDSILKLVQSAIPEPFKVELEWRDCTVFVSDEKNYIVLRPDGEIVTVKGSKWRGRDKEAMLTEFVPTYLQVYATKGKDAANHYAESVRDEIASGRGWKWVVRTHRVGKTDEVLTEAGFKVGELATYAYKDKKRRVIATSPYEGYDVQHYFRKFDEILKELNQSLQ